MPRILSATQRIYLLRLVDELNITTPPDIRSLVLAKHLEFQAATGSQKDILEDEALLGATAFGTALSRLAGKEMHNPNHHLPVG